MSFIEALNLRRSIKASGITFGYVDYLVFFALWNTESDC